MFCGNGQNSWNIRLVNYMNCESVWEIAHSFSMGKMASLSRFNSLIARNVMFFVYGTENMLVGQSVRLVKKIISNLLISTSIGGVMNRVNSYHTNNGEICGIVTRPLLLLLYFFCIDKRRIFNEQQFDDVWGGMM